MTFPSTEMSGYALLSYFFKCLQEHTSLLLITVVLANFHVYFLVDLSLFKDACCSLVLLLQ